VQYGELLGIGRELAEKQLPRARSQRLQRALLRALLPHPRRFAPLLSLGRALRGLLPARLRRALPAKIAAPGEWPGARHARRMLVARGCVQSALSPATNAAAARVLDRLGISLVEAPGAGCCGALSHHLAASEEGRVFARRAIDAWWPLLEQGAEAIVMTASGCGVHVRDYGALLAGDPDYADRAARIAAATRDLCELIDPAALAALRTDAAPSRLAVHTPCTLQHGQRLGGRVEELLRAAGAELTPVADAALCCGSAGTYALLQPELAERLGAAKTRALEQGAPAEIVTANIGCQTHLAARTTLPVRHWIEWLDEALGHDRP
jgi:glycolate oxidase iron-sulfur subunit